MKHASEKTLTIIPAGHELDQLEPCLTLSNLKCGPSSESVWPSVIKLTRNEGVSFDKAPPALFWNLITEATCFALSWEGESPGTVS